MKKVLIFILLLFQFGGVSANGDAVNGCSIFHRNDRLVNTDVEDYFHSFPEKEYVKSCYFLPNIDLLYELSEPRKKHDVWIYTEQPVFKSKNNESRDGGSKTKWTFSSPYPTVSSEKSTYMCREGKDDNCDAYNLKSFTSVRGLSVKSFREIILFSIDLNGKPIVELVNDERIRTPKWWSKIDDKKLVEGLNLEISSISFNDFDSYNQPGTYSVFLRNEKSIYLMYLDLDDPTPKIVAINELIP